MKVLYRITGIDGEAKEDFFGPAQDDDEKIILNLSKALIQQVEYMKDRRT